MKRNVIVLVALAVLAVLAVLAPRTEGLSAFSALETAEMVVRDGQDKVIYNEAKNKSTVTKSLRLANVVKCTRTAAADEDVQYGDHKDAIPILANLERRKDAVSKQFDANKARIIDLEKQIKALGNP